MKSLKVGTNWRGGVPLAHPRCAKKGPFRIFSTSIVAKDQQIGEGTLLGDKFLEKKSHNTEATLQSSPVHYVTRKNRNNFIGSFWFDTIKFRRNFVDLFWSVHRD